MCFVHNFNKNIIFYFINPKPGEGTKMKKVLFLGALILMLGGSCLARTLTVLVEGGDATLDNGQKVSDVFNAQIKIKLNNELHQNWMKVSNGQTINLPNNNKLLKVWAKQVSASESRATIPNKKHLGNSGNKTIKIKLKTYPLSNQPELHEVD